MITEDKVNAENVLEYKPKVIIILLNYNGWKDTIECLESIYSITYPNWELILIDNGSKDNSISRIKDWALGKTKAKSKFSNYNSYGDNLICIEELIYDEITSQIIISEWKEGCKSLSGKRLSILQIEENQGFTGGNNIGITYILQNKKANYILLLNNDTIVDKDFLNKLIEIGESDKKMGIIGPKIYYYNYNGRSDVINFMGADLIMQKGLEIRYGINEVDLGQFKTPRKVDKIEGSCMLIKEGVFREVGLFNTKYFAYWEDTDFCVRAKKRGYIIACAPEARIWHKGSKTSKKMSGFYEYYMVRNMFWFIKQHAARKQYISFLLNFFLFQFPHKIGVYLYHKNALVLIPFFKGIADGILRNDSNGR